MPFGSLVPACRGKGQRGTVVLLQDNFSGADATLLPSHSADIAPGSWATIFGQDLKLSSNKAVGSGANDNGNVMAAVGAEIRATFDIVYSSSDDFIGCLVRHSASDSFWFVYYQVGAGTWKIVERNAGVDTLRASQAQALTNGNTYAVRVECAGTTISLYVNDSLVTSYASATFNQSATGFGFYSNRSGAAPLTTFDSLLVVSQ